MLVVAAALIDGEGRCLMQQRPHGKRHGGLWEFPGGKVEPDEHPAAALMRELAEELAIDVAADALAPVGFATDMPVTMLLYRCAVWRGTPQPLAADGFCWERPAALARLPMPPVDVPLLAALARVLAGG
ncbi:8-oxo-dGTP diphosphatase [Sphingomonas endophytica]|uniref:8-oxo-dGTP diphosphatase n=1 Tax=Sphingomonas endophytica TaxID=869719 RepID=A0A7X0JGE9_9SPHN|nr:(deoxy)nucleoside triphosphate pyrophosphohydrolase [Sphingomonas endophytica]MBB6506257.1 8-oxo-dGTP diphosphatase [Sphingomonas endophytica]